ncbi:MAG: hypothetical protein KAY37_17865 [Phycisphaerae bacterium]|nr:hypothetical protein [Phycisphaerae bacterium]
MSTRRLLRRLGREWLVALASYALLIAPFGCEFEAQLLDLDFLLPGSSGASGTNGGLTTSSAGFFVNEDTSSSLLVAGRNSDGDAFFVYGTRTTDGGIHSVESILVKTADGAESYIVFEEGRPVLLKGPDGSYVRLDYTETSEVRLAADVTVYDATAGTTETTEVEIDIAQIQAGLLAAAGVGAEIIEDLTGQQVGVPESPEGAGAKWQHRAISTWLLAIAVVPLVVVSQFALAIMGQVMQAVFVSVTAALQSAVVTAFTPLIVFSSLLGDTLIRVEAIPLFEVFIELPSRPQIDIESW